MGRTGCYFTSRFGLAGMLHSMEAGFVCSLTLGSLGPWVPHHRIVSVWSFSKWSWQHVFISNITFYCPDNISMWYIGPCSQYFFKYFVKIICLRHFMYWELKISHNFRCTFCMVWIRKFLNFFYFGVLMPCIWEL